MGEDSEKNVYALEIWPWFCGIVHGDFNHEARFKDPGVFSEGTGMSIFTGPGTYDDHRAY